MKISTFIGLFLVIAAFMFIFGLMSQESKTYYPDSNMNDSEWYGKYDYASDINESVHPIKTAFDKIGDSELGWWSKLTSGIAAIPQAIIALPVLLFKSIYFGGQIIAGAFTSLLIPGIFIVIIGMMILVWAITKLMEVYQRWPI